MAEARADSEYDKFKALASKTPRPVDADFDQAMKQLQKLAKPKKTSRAKS